MSTSAATSAGWEQQRRFATISGGLTMDRLTGAARLLADDLRRDPPVELIPVRRKTT
jgi:hypothetical protein